MAAMYTDNSPIKKAMWIYLSKLQIHKVCLKVIYLHLNFSLIATSILPISCFNHICPTTMCCKMKIS